MLTMLLGGLWHGAAWTFVVWGVLHGVYLAVGRGGGAAATRASSGATGHGGARWAQRIAFHARLRGMGVLPRRLRSASPGVSWPAPVTGWTTPTGCS